MCRSIIKYYAACDHSIDTETRLGCRDKTNLMVAHNLDREEVKKLMDGCNWNSNFELVKKEEGYCYICELNGVPEQKKREEKENNQRAFDRKQAESDSNRPQ